MKGWGLWEARLEFGGAPDAARSANAGGRGWERVGEENPSGGVGVAGEVSGGRGVSGEVSRGSCGVRLGFGAALGVLMATGASADAAALGILNARMREAARMRTLTSVAVESTSESVLRARNCAACAMRWIGMFGVCVVMTRA